MLLTRVRIENFRRIGKLDLHLGDTTVLIGEAASGKTAVVDALAIALGFDAPATGFAFRDTDIPRGGHASECLIRIALDFTQEDGGSDLADGHEILAPAVIRDRSGGTSINFELKAWLESGADELSVDWRFGDGEGQTLVASDRPDVLQALRETFPILVIRGGLAFGNESLRREPEKLSADAEGGLDVATRERVRELYQRLLTARGTMHFAEAQALYERVRHFALEHLVSDAPPWLLESSERVFAKGSPRARPMEGSAQKIGVLLLAGALVEARARSHGSWSGHPILVVEDPEANLHPTVLAWVWELIDLLDVQKVLTTNSEAFLADVPLRLVRRLEREGGEVRGRFLGRRTLEPDELRKVSYHVRVRRGLALFARCWLLVEGETEAWLMPGLAHQCGYDLAVEAVCLMEFAQCGVEPLTKLANDLGIEWHLLTDGDDAGRSYADQARRHLCGVPPKQRITELPALDVEHYLWKSGYAHVYREAAWARSNSPNKPRNLRRTKPTPTIKRAVRNTSKPHLAIEVLHTMEEEEGRPPALLRQAIEASIRLARREGG